MGLSGDFSRLDGNQAKRHHFLRNSCCAGLRRSAVARSGCSEMHTASRGAPRLVDLRAAASRRRLYTAIDEDGEPSNRNEGYLALVESHAAPAIRHLMDDPASLSPAERATISFFVAFRQCARRLLRNRSPPSRTPPSRPSRASSCRIGEPSPSATARPPAASR